jgi:hypothetical protein
MHAYNIVCKKRYACATSYYREPRNLIMFQKLNLNTINIEGNHSKVSGMQSVTLMFQGQRKKPGKIIRCKDHQNMMGYILHREISM